MSSAPSAPPAPTLADAPLPDSLSVNTYTYSTPVPEAPLLVDVIASKALLAQTSSTTNAKTRVVLNIHGGCLVIGGRSITSPIAPRWLLAYMHLHDYVLLTADYRLLPESSGLDAVSDAEAAYQWTRNVLPTLLPNVDLDLDRVVVTGGSAGGYFATQLGIAHPEVTVIAGYPMFDLEDSHYTVQATTGYWGQPPVPREVIDKIIGSFVPGKIATERVKSPDVLAFGAGMMQQARLGEFLGDDDRVYPRRLLDAILASDASPKRAHQKWFVFHGEHDTVVPVRESKKLVERLERWGAQVRYVTKPGDHGFDSALDGEDQAAVHKGHWGGHEWLKEGLDWALAH
ncbi:hypothetical protein HDU89_008147 [Geranomyces variabilis]|nr:hypothetical protein HDU89_008147 [Geranomyces variabilis]